MPRPRASKIIALTSQGFIIISIILNLFRNLSFLRNKKKPSNLFKVKKFHHIG